jgi:hypothetical protein
LSSEPETLRFLLLVKQILIVGWPTPGNCLSIPKQPTVQISSNETPAANASSFVASMDVLLFSSSSGALFIRVIKYKN